MASISSADSANDDAEPFVWTASVEAILEKGSAMKLLSRRCARAGRLTSG